MKTWKRSRKVCASKKTGHFAKGWLCSGFTKRKVRRPLTRKGQGKLFFL